MKTELEYAQALLQKKGIYADLGMIAKSKSFSLETCMRVQRMTGR